MGGKHGKPKKWVVATPQPPREHAQRKRGRTPHESQPIRRKSAKQWVIADVPAQVRQPDETTSVLRFELIPGTKIERIYDNDDCKGTREPVYDPFGAIIGLGVFVSGLDQHESVSAFWESTEQAPHGWCDTCKSSTCAGVAWAEHCLVLGITDHELDNLPF